MIRRVIEFKKTGEKFVYFQHLDVDRVNPIEHYKHRFIVEHMTFLGVTDAEVENPTPRAHAMYMTATAQWASMMNRFRKTQVPDGLIALLTSNKKSEQEKLLKGVVLTSDILMAFYIRAYEEFGYTLSCYSFEHEAKDIDMSKMPRAFVVDYDDGSVKKWGTSDVSDAQLKHIMNNRRIKYGKILDNGDQWHCLLATFRGLWGQETWLGEKQPHYHYISNAFGISREKVVQEIQSEHYSLGNLPHIKLEDYGNQPAKKEEKKSEK